MTPEGEKILAGHEDDILHAYQDIHGYWTIGKGHCIDLKVGGEIPQEVSDWLFAHDIQRATALARNLDYFDKLDPVRQDVIVMLVFQMGLGNEKEATGVRGFVLMNQAIRERNWSEASFQLANSDWARKDVGPRRKADLCNALADGHW